MKSRLITLSIILLFFLTPAFASAEDIRAEVKSTRLQELATLKNALEAETAEARQEAENTRLSIDQEKERLLREIAAAEENNRNLNRNIDSLTQTLKKLKARKEKLETEKQNTSSESRELIGQIRVSVKDLDNALGESQQNVFKPDRTGFLSRMLDETTYPGYEDITRMANIAWDEIISAGEVRRETLNIVSRTGAETPAEVLVLGNFTAAYRSENETGFLVYSNKSHRFIALTNPPPFMTRRSINRYMDGKSEEVPIDISRGAGVRQLSNQVNLIDQVLSGGPVVWPILIIFFFGVVLCLERGVYILRNGISSNLARKMEELMIKGDLDGCRDLCATRVRKPVPNVLLTGLDNSDLNRQDLENILQETIMGHIPGLERFISTIGMLATISPLLGLLGTVTGMINTFHVITFFGTGDARMMSGGISEALVTTMLGLAVAIPILFGHTFISRAVENTIAQMEEKGVALINAIEKKRKWNDNDALANTAAH